MAYGVIASVPAPIDQYRAVNSAVMQQIGDAAPTGLLAHIARETPEGFQVIEIWESKQQAENFSDSVLAPIIDRVSEGQAPPREDITEEFDVEAFFVTAGAPASSAG